MKTSRSSPRWFNYTGSIALLFTVISATAQVSGDPRESILGEWTTAGGRSKVLIFKYQNEYCGKIVWIRDSLKAGKPVVDDKNPDAKLVNRPVMGIVFLKGFAFDEENVWRGGEIYDPESGNTYSAKMTLVDERTLELRGYVGIPLFGRTEAWNR